MSYYFTNDENLKSEIRINKVIISGLPFTLYTDNGVFSKKGLDFGTRTLLENLPDISKDVLDLGCGYGSIGIFVAKKFNVIPDMVDINKRGVALSLKNAIANNVKVNAFESDGFKEISKKYDYIITNPPIRIGKDKLYDLLLESLNHLKDNGELWLVINKNQGSKTLVEFFARENDVKVIVKNKGFYVIKVKKQLN